MVRWKRSSLPLVKVVKCTGSRWFGANFSRHASLSSVEGREFMLVSYRKNWGEERVFFDNGGTLISLPARWTDVLSPDPLVALSQGRSAFRADDLLELAELLRGIDARSPAGDPGDV